MMGNFNTISWEMAALELVAAIIIFGVSLAVMSAVHRVRVKINPTDEYQTIVLLLIWWPLIFVVGFAGMLATPVFVFWSAPDLLRVLAIPLNVVAYLLAPLLSELISILLVAFGSAALGIYASGKINQFYYGHYYWNLPQ